MARFNKSSKYDLKHPFRDSVGNHYRPEYAKELRAHIQMTPTAPTDRGPFKFTRGSNDPDFGNPFIANNESSQLYYRGYGVPGDASPVHRFKFGSSSHWRHKSLDSLDGEVVLDQTNGAISFSSAADNTNPTAASDDLPFSISILVNFTAHSDDNFICAKNADATGYKFEYAISGDSDGKVTFFLADDVDNYIAKKTGTVFDLNRWYHLVVTYNGAGNTAGITWYVDGAEVDSFSVTHGTYLGMHPDYNRAFYIGADQNALKELDGSFAEFAIWGAELSSEAVAAIYNITRESEPTFISGLTNNPPRTLLRSADRSEGAFPAALRGCQSDFMGRGLHPFDDLNTAIFTSNFAKASIEFVSHQDSPTNSVIFEAATFIGITGSVGLGNFTFVNGAGSTELVSAGTSYANEIKVDLSGSDQPSTIAEKFASKVNSQDFGIKADSIGSKVNLTFMIPNTGSFKEHGNLIVTGNLNNFKMDHGEPIKVEQFSSVANEKIKYPYALPVSYKNINSTIATPHVTDGIDADGTANPLKGNVVYNAKYSTENLRPFNDSRIHTDRGAFYEVGTAQNILPGFSAPLRSKSMISFDLASDPSDGDGLGTHIFYSTGSLAAGTDLVYDIANKTGSGMAYWNTINRRWEMLEPDTIDNQTLDGQKRVESCLGFAPADGDTKFNRVPDGQNNSSFLDAISGVGNPVSEFGFPTAKQYNATSSQCYNMSDLITTPFLLEKISLDIEGSFGLGQHIGTSNDVPVFKEFFILNQMTDGDNPHVTEISGTVSHLTQSSNGDAGSTEVISFEKKGHRELVAYAKIAFTTPEANTAPDLNSNRLAISGLAADLADEILFVDTSPIAVSASLKVDFTPSVASFSEGTSYLSLRSSANGQVTVDQDRTQAKGLMLTNAGGAACDGVLSGRQLASSFSNFPIFKTTNENANGNSILPKKIRRKVRQQSPYLLMPGDRLIFGWQNRPIAAGAGVYAGSTVDRTERGIATRFVDRIKKAKVTLFGSHVSDGVEMHHGSNQLLTANTVYETIGADPIVDKFDVSTISLLTGSTQDSLIIGQMLDGLENGVVKYHDSNGNLVGRRRFASVARGTQGTTGSLMRSSQHIQNGAVFSDSIYISVFDNPHQNAEIVVVETPEADPDGKDDTGNKGSGASIPLITPEDAAELLDAGAGPTVTFFGGTVAITDALNNFFRMFRNFPYDDTGELPAGLDGSNIPGGGGDTDPMPDALKFMDFGAISTLANSDGGGAALGTNMLGGTSLMMNAISAFDSYTTAQNIPGGGGSMQKMMEMAAGNMSPKKPVTEINFAATNVPVTVNPIMTQIRAIVGGQIEAMVLTGSHLDFLSGHQKFGLLAPHKIDKVIPYNGDYSMNSMVGTTFTEENDLSTYKPAGLKYGYSHAFIHAPEFYFSRRHFGHFADIIETPPTAKLNSSNGIIPGPVKVTFVSRGGKIGVDPATTNSVNLSVFCTSSVPYDEGDGQRRDRTSAQPDTLDDISIATSIEQVTDGEV